jgi:hypothetical protein
VGLEVSADSGELGVDLGGKAVQAGDGNEGDEGRNLIGPGISEPA